MLTEFIERVMRTADYKILEDGSFYGVLPKYQGVWATGKTLETCRGELREVFEDWLVLKVRDHEKVPGLRIDPDRRSLVKESH